MVDFDFTMPEEDGQRRRAFRAKVPGLVGRFAAQSKVFEVADLSGLGIAFLGASKYFREDELVEFDLFLNRKPFLAGMTARVVKVLGNGIVGMNFEGLNRQQEVRLDKLVLEVQKRMIALQKAREGQSE
ncbi:MAG: PilZ domain-containing protein [Desulfovibrionaceae bacterium]|jgi:hypothetical protein|nr:PilZ domain-containing protein [Desulfovibrionaceae bacterium]